MVVTFIFLLVDVISVLRFAFTIGVANLLFPADGKNLKNRTNWESFEVKFKFRFPFCVCRKERPKVVSLFINFFDVHHESFHQLTILHAIPTHQ